MVLYDRVMTQMPTPQDLAVLASDVAEIGIHAHSDAIDHIAQITEKSGLNPGAAAVLRDDAAPEVLRSRAFITIVRNWPEISEAAEKWNRFQHSFEALAAQSNEHHKLRASGDLAALWSSRTKLDALRAEATTQRLASAR